MLNEIQEYKEYTSDISELSTFRLIPEIFVREKGKDIDLMMGLPRAETVIARAELERVGYFETQLDAKEQREKIEEVIDTLRQWSGFDTPDTVTGWLGHYYNKAVEGRPGLPTWKEAAEKMGKQYNTTIVQAMKRSWNNPSNTMKTAYYEKIVANAVYLGPLKRYYLVHKIENMKKLKYNGNKIDLSKPKQSEKMDNALRLVAAYLLGQRLGKMKESQVNWQDLGHWAQTKTICKNDGYFKQITYGEKNNSKPLYQGLVLPKGINIAKIVVNPEFLKDFDFKLVEESEFNGVSEGYTYYSDLGAGYALQKNKEYEPLEKVDLLVM